MRSGSRPSWSRGPIQCPSRRAERFAIDGPRASQRADSSWSQRWRWPSLCAAEKFVPFGVQPDGSEVSVQASPPVRLYPTAGARAGSGPRRSRRESSPTNRAPSRNTAKCSRSTSPTVRYTGWARRCWCIAMPRGSSLAQFDLPPKSVEYVDVKPGTLGASMLEWLCAAPAPTPAPAVPAFPGPTSPFK